MATRLSKGILELIKKRAIDRASIQSAIKTVKSHGNGSYAVTLVERGRDFRRIKGRSYVIVVEVEAPDVSVELTRENRRRLRSH